MTQTYTHDPVLATAQHYSHRTSAARKKPAVLLSLAALLFVTLATGSLLLGLLITAPAVLIIRTLLRRAEHNNSRRAPETLHETIAGYGNRQHISEEQWRILRSDPNTW